MKISKGKLTDQLQKTNALLILSIQRFEIPQGKSPCFLDLMQESDVALHDLYEDSQNMLLVERRKYYNSCSDLKMDMEQLVKHSHYPHPILNIV